MADKKHRAGVLRKQPGGFEAFIPNSFPPLDGYALRHLVMQGWQEQGCEIDGERGLKSG